MKREKTYFRAERVNNKNIVYGLLSFHNNELCIITADNNKYFINEETLQQCIGLKDKNNNYIYVGDKLKHYEGKEFKIVFHDVKGVILSEINGIHEYFNGTPYWIDDCEII